MNRHKRPTEAALPAATRPQLVHIGRRRRIEHLSKNARVNEGTKPCGILNELRVGDLAQGPGSSSRGLAYRNSVFQALLNTPMFVNFVRMHSTRWHPSTSCPVYPSCLTCAMDNLAARYWRHEYKAESARVESVAIGCKQLWDLCQRTFWPRPAPLGRIGPSNLEDEFYSDTFLLNLLKEMKSQLERSPSEYQTFEKMFAVHTVCRWKCNSMSCGWTSAPYKWESSLHLNLAVQRPQPKSRQTPVLIGIERALRTKLRLTGRRASTPHQEKCEKCQRPIESSTDIVSLPEILVVVRDIEELLPGDEPDIPFRQELNLSRLATGPDNHLDPKGYELVSGIAESRYSPLVSRNCAFARAAKDSGDKWYCIMDEIVQDTEFSVLDKLQRSVSDGGLADGIKISPICPEVFIYRLRDYDARSELIDSFGPTSPLNDSTMVRTAISRTINDIFTQKVGKGLLKFKVKISPADPGPVDNHTIEVDLKLSYEIDGKHYGIVNQEQNYLAFQLRPVQLTEQDKIDAVWTPYEGRAIDRAVRTARGTYPLSRQITSPSAGPVELPSFNTGYRLPYTSNNPFIQAAADGMNLDPEYIYPSTDAQNPRIAEQTKKDREQIRKDKEWIKKEKERIRKAKEGLENKRGGGGGGGGSRQGNNNNRNGKNGGPNGGSRNGRGNRGGYRG